MKRLSILAISAFSLLALCQTASIAGSVQVEPGEMRANTVKPDSGNQQGMMHRWWSKHQDHGANSTWCGGAIAMNGRPGNGACAASGEDQPRGHRWNSKTTTPRDSKTTTPR